jgi:Fe-S-cluster containining protein
MLQKLEVQVLELYGAADQAVVIYQQASGLGCPGGCVQCCYSEKVELILKRIEKQDSSRQCILFRPDLSSNEAGGCTLYPFRALICRLFGFAGNTDRNGVPQLARCRNMPLPAPVRRQTGPETQIKMPLFHSYGLAITAMHPHLGTLRKPINESLYEALAKVGLILDLEPIPMDMTKIDLPPDAPMTTPTKPRRKAA